MSSNARHWRKSSLSSNGENCVEVTADGDCILVRDSKYLRDPANDPSLQPIITIAQHDWAQFLDLVAGRVDVGAAVEVIPSHDGGAAIRSTDGTELRYTPGEWEAFVGGVLAGEFDLPQAVAA